MRVIRITIFSFSLIAFLACNESPRNENNSEMGQADTLNSQSNYDNATTRRTNSDTLTQSSDPSGASNELHGQDRTKMYKDLGMTDDEIERFEEDFQRKVNAIKTHGRGDYTAEHVENQEGQSMRAVLSDAQYKKYLEWKESHSTSEE